MKGYVKVMRLEWKLRWLERAMIEETKPIPWLLVLVQNLRIGDKYRMLVFICSAWEV